MSAIKTGLMTADGLFVYDLDPQASELWTVAGPDGVDPTSIDIDDLPAGFRFVTEYEWQSLQDTEEPTFGWRVITSANGTGLDGVVFASEQEAQKACEVCKKFSWEDTEFFVVKTTLQPTCTFDEWHAQDLGIDDEQEEQDDEPAMPTIVLCPCTEWVRENMNVDFTGVDTGLANLAADAFMEQLEQLLSKAGFNVIYGKNSLLTYHGWNGHRWFRQKLGVAATYDCLTDEQFDKVGELIQESQDMIERHHIDCVRRRSFPFKSDSESGTLTADSFADACQQLRDMYPPEIVEDGGWGWVEDHDGQRFVVGEIP